MKLTAKQAGEQDNLFKLRCQALLLHFKVLHLLFCPLELLSPGVSGTLCGIQGCHGSICFLLHNSQPKCVFGLPSKVTGVQHMKDKNLDSLLLQLSVVVVASHVTHLQPLLYCEAFVALHEHRVELQSLTFGSVLHTAACQSIGSQVALHLTCTIFDRRMAMYAGTKLQALHNLKTVDCLDLT